MEVTFAEESSAIYKGLLHYLGYTPPPICLIFKIPYII